MDSKSRVMHFDLHADRPENSKKFFESVFGWKFEKWNGPMEYWMITTGKDGTPGINGGLAKKGDPGPMPVLTVGTMDLDKTLESVRRNGGKITSKKAPIPGVGWFAAFQDPEGNVLGLMQNDPKAR
jgi:predicted enzyme related to lactoylglutathione lyase